MATKMRYQLPIDKDKILKILTKKSLAHRIYKNAVDFIAPLGTPIKAAADGLVIEIKEDSTKFGVTRDYEKYENFIILRHGKNEYEYSYYGHIKHKGAAVKIGQKVKASQVIGYVGKTGWMANIPEPHLHFMVVKYKYETLKIKFKK